MPPKCAATLTGTGVPNVNINSFEDILSLLHHEGGPFNAHARIAPAGQSGAVIPQVGFVYSLVTIAMALGARDG